MSEENENSIWLLFLAFGVSALLVGSILVLFISVLVNRFVATTNSIGTSVQIVSIVVSALLTLGLILIYRDIRESEKEQGQWMEKQTAILREQQKLSESQFKPLLSVSFTDDDVSGDEITLTCENTGTGIAKGLQLEFQLFVSDVDRDGPIGPVEGHSLEPISEVVEIYQDEAIGASGSQTVDAQRGFFAQAGQLEYKDHNEGRRIRSEPVVKDDREEVLTASLHVMEYSGIAADRSNGSPVSFEYATGELVDMDYTVIGYRLKFKYEDILDEERDSTLLSSGFASLEAGMSFEDIYENSTGVVGRLRPYMSMDERYVAMF